MKRLLPIFLVAAVLLSACGASDVEDETTLQITAEDPSAETEAEATDSSPILAEVAGQVVVVDESLALSEFTAADFERDTSTGRVNCVTRDALTGVDVSSHQGKIDWSAAADDIDYAILRIGNRGYTQGNIRPDETFEDNYFGARGNGLPVGVYFFSQAITVAEAEQEADFVLSALDGRALELPVVYDWEEITDDTARTDGLDGQTVTSCARAFCEKIQSAGYDAAVYCSAATGYLIYDLSQLQEYSLWYAGYGSSPDFAYAFSMWQYTKSASVNGISGKVDLNLYFP